MFMPEFPNTDLSQEQVLNMILASIAMEEIALSHAASIIFVWNDRCHWSDWPHDLRKTAKPLILCGLKEYQNKI